MQLFFIAFHVTSVYSTFKFASILHPSFMTFNRDSYGFGISRAARTYRICKIPQLSKEKSRVRDTFFEKNLTDLISGGTC